MRTYQEFVAALRGGERDPAAVEALIAAHYDQFDGAVAERCAVVLSTCVFVRALEAVTRTVAASPP